MLKWSNLNSNVAFQKNSKKVNVLLKKKVTLSHKSSYSFWRKKKKKITHIIHDHTSCNTYYYHQYISVQQQQHIKILMTGP